MYSFPTEVRKSFLDRVSTGSDSDLVCVQQDISQMFLTPRFYQVAIAPCTDPIQVRVLLLNVGDEIDHESGTFRVEKVDGRRILRVRFQPRVKEAFQAQALIPLVSAVGSSLM